MTYHRLICRWLIPDERGSIIARDNAGSVSINTYDEYGQGGGSNAGRFQYVGLPWIAEAGLYQMGARAYAPSIGRWMQTDPILTAGGVNLYAYVGNDPVNGIDPSGLRRIRPTTVTGSIIPGVDPIGSSGCSGECEGRLTREQARALEGAVNKIEALAANESNADLSAVYTRVAQALTDSRVTFRIGDLSDEFGHTFARRGPGGVRIVIVLDIVAINDFARRSLLSSNPVVQDLIFEGTVFHEGYHAAAYLRGLWSRGGEELAAYYYESHFYSSMGNRFTEQERRDFYTQGSLVRN